MSIEQLGLQLGLAGLIVLVGYKLAMTFIATWSKNEQERTKEMTTSFRELTTQTSTGLRDLSSKLENHAHADSDSHMVMATTISRFEGKLDHIMNWQERTPVGIQAEHYTPTEIPALPAPPSERRSQVYAIHNRSNKKGTDR